MTCRQSEELIQKSLDGALSLPERARLDAHLADCGACRAAWEEHRRLARLARRWVPQAGLGEEVDEAFTARVLARIAVPCPSVSARPSLWLPLCVAALVTFLPHISWPGLPDIVGPARDLPRWLLANGRALPSDLMTSWATLNAGLLVPAWVWLALLGAGAANGLFLARATLTHTKGILR